MLRYSKQGQLAVNELVRVDNRWGSVVVKLLLREAGRRGQGQVRNPEKEGSPPLEATTKQQLAKAIAD
jgi:hypothetical protein